MGISAQVLKNRPLIALCLFVFTIIVYSPSLTNEFVWDDIESIQKSVHSLGSSNLKQIALPYTETNSQARYWRPLFYASIVLDKYLWGGSPSGYHLSNNILYAITVILFYLIALIIISRSQVGSGDTTALLSALLFAVYPMHVETVSWVVGRTDILACLFLLSAIIFHLRAESRLWLVVFAGLSFILALLSKEVAVVFPALVLGYDLIFHRSNFRNSIPRYAVYVAILIIYYYLRGMGHITISGPSGNLFTDSPATTDSIWQIIKTIFTTYLFYISKLTLPFDFNAFITGIPISSAKFLGSLVVSIFLLFAFIISVARRENVTAFCVLWVTATLMPALALTVFNIAATPYAERYLFLPSAGYCLLMGYLIVRANGTNGLTIPAALFAAILIAAYTFFTIERQAVWTNDLSLWADTVKKSPTHPLPLNNHGRALLIEGDYDGALRYLHKALSPELNDTPKGKAMTSNNIGLVHLETANFPLAEKWFVRAKEYDPSYGRTYYHLGLINFIKADMTRDNNYYKKAESNLIKTLEIYSTYPRANLLLAKVYVKMGYPEKAKAQARIAVESGLETKLLKEAQNILVIDDKPGE